MAALSVPAAGVSTEASNAAHVEGAIEQATALLNADCPEAAAQVLGAFAQTPEAHNHYGFQSRYGVAQLGIVDKLNDANALGHFAVTRTQGAERPTITAQRLDCYIAAMGANARFLQILQDPQRRADFIAKNGEGVLAEVEPGVAAGIAHAHLEISLFLTRVAQINCNAASTPFVQRMLASGRLKETDTVVQSFREVHADPLYDAIMAACAPISADAVMRCENIQEMWPRWASLEIERYNAKAQSALMNTGVQ